MLSRVQQLQPLAPWLYYLNWLLVMPIVIGAPIPYFMAHGLLFSNATADAINLGFCLLFTDIAVLCFRWSSRKLHQVGNIVLIFFYVRRIIELFRILYEHIWLTP